MVKNKIRRRLDSFICRRGINTKFPKSTIAKITNYSLSWCQSIKMHWLHKCDIDIYILQMNLWEIYDMFGICRYVYLPRFHHFKSHDTRDSHSNRNGTQILFRISWSRIKVIEPFGLSSQKRQGRLWESFLWYIRFDQTVIIKFWAIIIWFKWEGFMKEITSLNFNTCIFTFAS